MCRCGHAKANHDEEEGYCRKCHFCYLYVEEEVEVEEKVEMAYAPDPDCKKCGGEGWVVSYSSTPERDPCECIELREVEDDRQR